MADLNAVICRGEALVDRLGPPGGNPGCDRPVDDRLGVHPRMWRVVWRVLVQQSPSLGV